MQTTASIDLIEKAYHAQVGLSDSSFAQPLTGAERDAFAHVGNQVIACGGVFGSGESEFTLPDDDRLFPGEFPVKHIFDNANLALANAQAVIWRDTILSRMQTARDDALETAVGTIGRTASNV